MHKLPVDALKIDRSFVRSLVVSDRPAIVESILALARTLKTSVVAEGIESEDQARELERLGCTHAQGFLFSRPLPVRVAEQLLEANKPLGPPRPTHQSDAFATNRNETERYQPSTGRQDGRNRCVTAPVKSLGARAQQWRATRHRHFAPAWSP